MYTVKYYYYKPADYITIYKASTVPTNAAIGMQTYTTLLGNVQAKRWKGPDRSR